MSLIDTVKHFTDFVKTYQIFSSIVGGSIIGTLFYTLRTIPSTIVGWFKYFFTVEFRAQNDIVQFDWLDTWLAEQDFTRKVRRVNLIFKKPKGEDDD